MIFYFIFSVQKQYSEAKRKEKREDIFCQSICSFSSLYPFFFKLDVFQENYHLLEARIFSLTLEIE